MVDFFQILQALNLVNFFNVFLPKGMGEVIVLFLVIAGGWCLWELYWIRKTTGNFIALMKQSKKSGLPMTFRRTEKGLYEPGLLDKTDAKEGTIKYKDAHTWLLDPQQFSYFSNVVRFTFLLEGKPSNLSLDAVVKALDQTNPSFAGLPSAAANTARINNLANMKMATVDEGMDKFMKWIPWIVLLLVVFGGMYMLIQALPANHMTVDIAQATTTTLPTVNTTSLIKF